LRHKIQFSTRALDHLALLRAHRRRQVLDEIERQLAFEPQAATRNRKRLRPNVLADWELRVGELRVYYLVTEDPESLVSVVALGEKRGSRVFIGGEELKL
jgi:mRNA-degrading endonuclease RelE of RelBE toxin-antitoxin system